MQIVTLELGAPAAFLNEALQPPAAASITEVRFCVVIVVVDVIVVVWFDL